MNKNLLFISLCLISLAIGVSSCNSQNSPISTNIISGSKVENHIEAFVSNNPNAFNNAISEEQFIEQFESDICSFTTNPSCLSDLKLQCKKVDEVNGHIQTYFEGEINESEYDVYFFVFMNTPQQYVSQFTLYDSYYLQFHTSNVSVDRIFIGDKRSFRIYINGELTSIAQ